MLIIDRYLLRQFFSTLVICFTSLMGLYVVFDVFTNLEEFIRCGEKVGGTLRLIATHYGYQTLAVFDRTSAVLALVAAVVTVAWIQRHHEMTALMAAGVPRARIVRPLLCAAVGVSLLAAVNREALTPRLIDKLARQPQDLLGDKGQQMHPQRDRRTNIVIHGKATYADQQRIEEPAFQMPRSLDRYGPQLVAKQAYYRPASNGRPSGYLLDQVSEPKGLVQRPSLYLDGKPVLITPADADWLQPDQCFVVSDVSFEQLTGGQGLRQFGSLTQMIVALRNPSFYFGAELRVAVHARIVQPFLDITLFMLGLPLVASRQNRNIFIAIGLCLLVVSVFSAVVIGAQYLGTICLISPAMAAWLPLMIFVPPAVILAEGLRR